jgi:hypothetical protein
MLVRDSGPHIVRIERLEDELQTARDRIKELEAALGLHDDIQPLIRLGLSKSEARVVSLLSKRQHVTREQALLAIYAEDPERRYDVQDQVVDVFICNARRKLRRLGVEFGSPALWSARGGYVMPGDSKSRLAKLIASGARLVTRGRPDRKHYKTARLTINSDQVNQNIA